MEHMQLIWGWQPALYLFLGGMGAGTFIAAAVLFLRNRNKNNLIVNVSMWAGVACLCVGLLLLLSELINPVRGLMLWQSFSHMTSWMTFGAWAVLAAVIVFGVLALITTAPVENWWRERQEGEGEASDTITPLRESAVCTVLAVAGIVLGLCVAAYTGVLLMTVPGVALWHTLLLPCLFTVSALDTGIALVEVVALLLARKDELSKKSSKLLERGVVVLVVLEAAVLAAFVATMLAGNPANAGGSESFAATARMSIELLLSGSLWPFFWILFVLCGLVVPLVASLKALSAKKKSSATLATGAVGALIGGCALRFIVLLAGLHVNYVADTVAQLLI